jgi:cobalt-precorrin-6B (C15)-methyltransferase
MAPLWPYATPGIPDALFEQMPGIPISKREVRLLIIGALRLHPSAVLWDIGAGIGTIAVEAALLCPAGQVVAIERDEDVVSVIRHNCDRFGLKYQLHCVFNLIFIRAADLVVAPTALQC